MKTKVFLISLLLIESFVQGQFDSGYQARPRGGHFISNGQYHNQATPQTYNHNQQAPNSNSFNVIGNSADSIYGGGTANSIINPGSSQGSYNVVGNKASNIQGGTVNSIVNGPSDRDIAQFSFDYAQRILAQQIAQNPNIYNYFGRKK